MIAHLGMYDRAETASANDHLWSAIRANLGHGPETLSRGVDFWETWRSPNLLLSQTCGLPYRSRLHGSVTLVGTPDYGLPGCPPGHYASVFVAHRDKAGTPLADFEGATLAYNDVLSQSGWAAPMTHLTGAGLTPGRLVVSGGHAASATAVAEKRADFAGLDALSWQLIQRHDAMASDLVEIARTRPTPALPFITALSRDPQPLFDAITAAIAILSAHDRDTLHLNGIVAIPASAYLAVPTPPGPVPA